MGLLPSFGSPEYDAIMIVSHQSDTDPICNIGGKNVEQRGGSQTLHRVVLDRTSGQVGIPDMKNMRVVKTKNCEMLKICIAYVTKAKS